MTTILRLENITMKYGSDTALNSVSLDIESGSLVGIRGENGAGKSTLMGIMAGALKPTSGRRIAASSIRDGICYVPQDVALYSELTGKQNLEYWAEVYGIRGLAKRTRIRYLLDLMELTDKANKRVSTYSGGMKRRLNLAAALVVTPHLLLLDEPTVGADEHSIGVMLDAITRMRDNGSAIVMISHMRNDLDCICDRLITMTKGGIIADERLTRAATV